MPNVELKFSALFGRLEHALKRAGFLRAGRTDAQADWDAFADALGVDFYKYVVHHRIAETLIAQPPGRLLSEGPVWNRPDAALSSTIELFVRGVCRVRNNLVHGEKPLDDPAQTDRDLVLIREAMQVLEAAADRVPEVSKQLRTQAHPRSLF